MSPIIVCWLCIIGHLCVKCPPFPLWYFTFVVVFECFAIRHNFVFLCVAVIIIMPITFAYKCLFRWTCKSPMPALCFAMYASLHVLLFFITLSPYHPLQFFRLILSHSLTLFLAVGPCSSEEIHKTLQTKNKAQLIQSRVGQCSEASLWEHTRQWRRSDRYIPHES